MKFDLDKALAAARTGRSEDVKKAQGDVKLPMHLLPTVAAAAMVKALNHGAMKYGAYNWRSSGIEAVTYVAAMMRHLEAWRSGEDKDPDSGESHLAHIMANCAIVLDAEAAGALKDNRYRDFIP